ncbi:marginal zone B- and B1-cell-specific protein [Nephila pilipes]|uniref:Marginal zone B- and B1-cell-specific protein n=1 Tax=Nephila pilipes TaxID=299642 RepID=A0A8X6QIK2_NEPPI|nr:marginal zone B- and B1-cell-specific protein [Nephila pilipes]
MQVHSKFLLFILIACLNYMIGAEVFVGKEGPHTPPPGKKISLPIPQLSDEETESNHMPHHLKCDACLAVAYQIEKAFSKEKKKKTTLKEYDVLEIVENICTKGFENYGLKLVEGVNRLSGPGLETERVMGMTQMGGRWPTRLQEMCHYYMGEAGELEMYNAFLEGQNQLTNFLCYGTDIYSHCNHMKPPIQKEL